MVRHGLSSWVSVSFLHVMSRFSKLSVQQHSAGNGSLLWALSVPLWFCWVCQEYKALTALNQGDFSGFYLSWGYEGWDNTSLRKQGYFCSLQKQEISQILGSICVSQPSARVSIHVYLPCPQGTLGICSTGSNLMFCLCCQWKSLCLTQESYVRICQSVAN